MKITFEREKFQSAFQTAAAVAPARSPKPILQNVKLEVTPDERPCSWPPTWKSAFASTSPASKSKRPAAAVLPINQFGQILREIARRAALDRSRPAKHARPRRAQRVPPAAPKTPTSSPPSPQFNEEKFTELPARLLPRADPPHALRHRQRKQPLRPGRRAAGNERQRNHRRRHRRPPAGQDGRPRHAASAAIKPPTARRSCPTRAMQLIERALTDADGEVQLAARGNDVLVRSPRATIYSRLVEGRFPRWRDVFPQRHRRGEDRAVGRRRFTPPSARRRSSPAKRAAASISSSPTASSCSRGRAAEVGPVARRTADRLRRPGESRSPSTPATSAIFSRCSTPKRPSRWRSKTPKAPPSAAPTTATATSSCRWPATANDCIVRSKVRSRTLRPELQTLHDTCRPNPSPTSSPS